MKQIFDTYYEYESALAQQVLIPVLKHYNISLDNKRVLDIGCGEGGILSGLAEKFAINGIGIDYDNEMIQRCHSSEKIAFEKMDFLRHNFKQPFDCIILRDVLEHCGDMAIMLNKIVEILAPGGWFYMTYTPLNSPFGGHQHAGGGFWSNVPYIHLLPQKTFLKLVKPVDTYYKTAQAFRQDLRHILKTCAATSTVIKLLKQYQLNTIVKRSYLLRPDYKIKFGLPTVLWPRFFPLNNFTDFCCTSIEMILQKCD